MAYQCDSCGWTRIRRLNSEDQRGEQGAMNAGVWLVRSAVTGEICVQKVCRPIDFERSDLPVPNEMAVMRYFAEQGGHENVNRLVDFLCNERRRLGCLMLERCELGTLEGLVLRQARCLKDILCMPTDQDSQVQTSDDFDPRSLPLAHLHLTRRGPGFYPLRRRERFAEPNASKRLVRSSAHGHQALQHLHLWETVFPQPSLPDHRPRRLRLLRAPRRPEQHADKSSRDRPAVDSTRSSALVGDERRVAAR